MQKPHGNRSIVSMSLVIALAFMFGAFCLTANAQSEIKRSATDGASSDRFGDAVSIDGDLVLIGAYGDDDRGDSSGSVYLYDLAGNPVPTLAVSPDPLVAGYYGRFPVTNVKPNTETYLAFSLMGPGSTYYAPLNITLGRARPAG